MGDSDFSAIIELIPQISYEIVGRIVPGLIVLFSLIVVATGPNRSINYLDQTVIHPDPPLSGWAIVLTIVAAYVLAFVLDGVWQIPTCLRRRDEYFCPPNLQTPSLSLKFEYVNQNLPKAGAWLTKLYAETNAAQVLITGWAISAAINLYLLAIAFSEERLWLKVGLIVGIVGAVAVRNSITTTRDESLENLWVLAKERPLKEQSEKMSEERKGS